MKVRLDFVTNSSSSCYILGCGEVIDKEKLLAYLTEEYGKAGTSVFQNYLVKGSKMLEDNDDNYYNLLGEISIESLDPDKYYVCIDDSSYEGIPSVDQCVASEVSATNVDGIIRSLINCSYIGYN